MGVFVIILLHQKFAWLRRSRVFEMSGRLFVWSELCIHVVYSKFKLKFQLARVSRLFLRLSTGSSSSRHSVDVYKLNNLAPWNSLHESNFDDQRKPSTDRIQHAKTFLPMNFRMIKLLVQVAFLFRQCSILINERLSLFIPPGLVSKSSANDWMWQLRDYIFIFNHHHQNRIWWVAGCAR